MSRFEKFDVCHQAIEFADQVDEITKSFPCDERFGLSSQMRKAAVSISSNIAERTTRKSDRKFSRFAEIANGSLMGVVSQACAATRQRWMSAVQLERFRQSGDQPARMLSGLQSTLND